MARRSRKNWITFTRKRLRTHFKVILCEIEYTSRFFSRIFFLKFADFCPKNLNFYEKKPTFSENSKKFKLSCYENHSKQNFWWLCVYFIVFSVKINIFYKIFKKHRFFSEKTLKIYNFCVKIEFRIENVWLSVISPSHR